MEDIFHRLTIFIAIVALLGFGGASVYSFYRAHSAQDIVTMLYGWKNESVAKCEEDRKSVDCGFISKYNKWFDEAVVERNQYTEKAQSFLTASITIPVVSFLLFFGLRWVITGRLPEFRKLRHVSPTHQPNQAVTKPPRG